LIQLTSQIKNKLHHHHSQDTATYFELNESIK
jgi:hypothetical protein